MPNKKMEGCSKENGKEGEIRSGDQTLRGKDDEPAPGTRSNDAIAERNQSTVKTPLLHGTLGAAKVLCGLFNGSVAGGLRRGRPCLLCARGAMLPSIHREFHHPPRFQPGLFLVRYILPR